MKMNIEITITKKLSFCEKFTQGTWNLIEPSGTEVIQSHKQIADQSTKGTKNYGI